ncbi:Serine/threonine-protein kinase PknD [Madurella mycetomatis]|uniref:Serine/threonine-protein kinase PknD n=1 Tax=Madurella mycetomatis TaxID=100816 RepID=A0A175W2R1_9PEZI|nr:Serine/threonine-protein kinase PknD [Madurella mycetomatis]
MWWDTDAIERTVTRQFVCSHLIPLEIERLDQPLGFGDGLTDGTYWEWISGKAKRIFLILVELGVPDQIFGVIDDSWDDEDLPIALDQIERLALTASKDERFERRFYSRQFHYLLRPLQKGDHTYYQEDEVVPLDILDKKYAASRQVDKVVLPNQPGMVFCRRRIPVGPGHLSHEDLLFEIDGFKNVQNEHLVSYWASYVHRGYGYVLFTPATDFTLKSLFTSTPSCVRDLTKTDRRQLIMNWVHCLVDTLCFLHNRGLSHGNIKPSTILFSNTNRVFFSDLSRFQTEPVAGKSAWRLIGSANGGYKAPGDSSSMTDRSSFDKESYDYAAPEQWFRPASVSTSTVRRAVTEYGQIYGQMPHLDPQAADVFSLGCVILDLLSSLFKKHGKPFAVHRAAKHKSPGRGGAVRDSSFHRNLCQVESWMTQLSREAAKNEDPLFRGISPVLHVVERMLAPQPSERPAANDVQARMYQILTGPCGISEPHCVHQYGGWGAGIGNVKFGFPALARSGSHDTMSITTRQNKGIQSGHRRKRSGGSTSGSGSIRRTGSIIGEAEREHARTKITDDSPGGYQLCRNKSRPWQAPMYASHGFVLFDR